MNRHCVPNAINGYPGRPPNGGSNPRFYDFDDGVTRLVKWHPSPHGVKACYNELFASRLGQLIDAPILRGSVVFVADDTIPAEHRRDGGAAEGFHFGIARVPGQNFVEAHYTDIQNHAELPMAAAFLAWLNVGDQQNHNQFLRLQHEFGTTTIKSKTFLLIDMGNAFHNFNWTEADLGRLHDSYVLPRHMASKLSLAALQTAVDAIQGRSLQDIEQCLGDTPQSWGITEGERVAATRSIDGVRGSLMDILRKGNPDIR